MDRARAPSAWFFSFSCLVVAALSACGGGPSGSSSAVSPTAVNAVFPPVHLALLAGQTGGPGNLDGVGITARFDHPADAVADAAGNLYVTDYGNSTVRRISSQGDVTTFAGSPGMSGSLDGNGTAARFNHPQNITRDGRGNLYVSDTWNNTIRVISPAGQVSTLAGQPGLTGSQDGDVANASFNMPSGLAVSADGNIFVADSGNNTIRVISPAGIVSTYAGIAGTAGHEDGPASQSTFNMPTFLILDASGNLYVADSWNETIRKIGVDHMVTTLAGLPGITGSANGGIGIATFSMPYGMAWDSSGNLLVAEGGNHDIRAISAGGMVTTRAGLAGQPGSDDGALDTAHFKHPVGLTVDSGGVIYVVDNGNDDIRRITTAGQVEDWAGAPARPGSADGQGASARFDMPVGMAADLSGNIYVADCANNTIRKITPGGAVSTVAGSSGKAGSADGEALQALFNYPTSLAIDAQGNIYVSDSLNNTIRKISNGMVTTLAGYAGVPGATDGDGASARFSYPSGLAVDADGVVYVADNDNNTIRKISAGGTVTTLAGVAGQGGYADGAGAAARFDHPAGLVLDSAGNIVVSDALNNVIRKVDASGRVTTLAGQPGQAGDLDGAGAAAQFNQPGALAVDANGRLYVADWGNHALRRISADTRVITVMGSNTDQGVRLGDDPRPGDIQGLAAIGGLVSFTSANAVLQMSSR